MLFKRLDPNPSRFPDPCPSPPHDEIGVPISFLLARGQQIKVFSMLLRKCNEKGLRIPNLPKKKGPDDTTYEGATVNCANHG